MIYGKSSTIEQCLSSRYGRLSTSQAEIMGLSKDLLVKHCEAKSNKKLFVPQQYWDYHYYSSRKEHSLDTFKVNDEFQYNSRNTPCSSSYKPKDSTQTSIWMFGGSTILNSETSDEYTISNELCKLYQPKEVEVLNLGVGGFHSEIQTMKLLNLYKLSTFNEKTPKKPDIVIFYDGFNDSSKLFTRTNVTGIQQDLSAKISASINDSASIPKIKMAYWSLKYLSSIAYFVADGKQNLISRAFDKLSNNFVLDSMLENPLVSNPIPTKSLSTTLIEAKSYIHDQKILRALCNGIKIKCYVFLQPILATRLNPVGEIESSVHNELSNKNRIQNAKNFYEIVSNEIDDLNNTPFYKIFDISDMFNGHELRQIPVFYDYGHTGFFSSKFIAKEMFDRIN